MTSTVILKCIDDDLFPGYSKKTIKALCSFYYTFTYYTALDLYENGWYPAVVCFLINIFHMAILFCKSMRTSSVFLIMATVALMDIISLACVIGESSILFYQALYPCYSKAADYNLMVVEMIRQHVKNFTQRCSTWLSLSITIIRALVIRYPMNTRLERLSRSKSVIFIVGGITLIIIPISIADFFRLSVSISNKNFDCRTNNMNIRYYSVYTTNLFHKIRYDQAYKIADGVISKIIPCVLFPLATIILFKEIRKANIRRKGMASIPTSSSHLNTSYLVLAQTATFFITELPLGIVFLMQSTNPTAGIDILLGSFETFFSSCLTIRTPTHMIICIFMSSQYRLAVRLFVRGGYPLKVNKKESSISLTQRM